MNIERMLSKAKTLQKKGDKTGAAGIYKEILTKFPKNARAAQELQKLTGNQTQQINPQALQQLVGLFQHGHHSQAIQLGKQILQIDSANITAHNVLAASLSSNNQHSEAVKHFQAVIKMQPNDDKAYLNLGTAFLALQQLAQAKACYDKVIELNPNSSLGHFNLSVILKNVGDVVRALEASKVAFQLDSNNPQIANNHAVLFILNNQLDEAKNILDDWIEKTPDNFFLYANRARIYSKKGQLKAAKADLDKVKTLNAPLNAYVEAAATLLLDFKEYDTAIALLEQAQQENQTKPLTPLALNQCYPLYEDTEASKLRTKLVASRLVVEAPFEHSSKQKDAAKPLKIGYLSPDFANHSVARFFEPLIQNHSDAVETYCYYNYPVHDEVTDRIKQAANHWHDVAALAEVDIAKLVHTDSIDILVDLAGHTGDNGLGVFAYKPAPLQVSWLGFPDTTGLDTIDYRFIDDLTDPEGAGDDYYCETLYRLPESFLAYLGDDTIIASPTLPYEANGYITFGSFNNLSKVTEDVIETWAEILKQVPNSKLLMKGSRLEFEELQDVYFALFAKYGIDQQRLELIGQVKSVDEHLKLYDKVDICLDCFPYNGTTTTFEALWMGVPVVTYVGKRHAARVGYSIMSNLGYKDWIADDLAAYVDVAVGWAQDTDGLATIRRNLRADMKASVLYDHKQFAENMETAYFDIWGRYLAES